MPATTPWTKPRSIRRDRPRPEPPHDTALAGATPSLRMCGIVSSGWLLARSALAAQERMDRDGSGGDKLFEQKIVTARFQCGQLLPSAAASKLPSRPCPPTWSPGLFTPG
ncbi:MAG: acyl-CoA dehydrogenase C-terminal domain-containing protein [Acidimicrobiales bacterium]